MLPVRLLSMALVAMLFVACGPRQPAEPAAPAPTPAPAVPEPAPAAEPSPVSPEAPVASVETPASPYRPTVSLEDAMALMTEWNNIISDPEIDARDLRLKQVGLALVNLGPEACMPLLELMADESEEPMVRYHAMLSLEEWVVPPFLDYLVPLVDDDQDELTRSFGAYLIGLLETRDIIPILEELVQEDDRRIQFGAKLGLARMRHMNYEDHILDEFRSADASSAERTAIAFMLAERMDPLLTDFYLEAASDPTVEPGARAECLKALSEIADPSTLPELRAISANPELADQQPAADYAIRMIEMHMSGALQPFPPIQ